MNGAKRDWVLLFAVAQIIGNILLISLFRYKNFAISITYIKSETLFVALIGVLFLSEQLSLGGWLGFFIAFFGLIFSSLAKNKINFHSLKNTSKSIESYLGLLSGLMFAIGVFGIKKAMFYINTNVLILKPVYALLPALIFQVIVLSIYLFFKKRKNLLHILRHPQQPILIGFFSIIGTLLLVYAFTLTYLANVKTVGQLDFLFSLIISVIVLKEKIYKNEIIGMSLIVTGIVLLVVYS